MQPILEGTRYNTLLPLARQAWEEGQDLQDTWQRLDGINTASCVPPLRPRTVRRIIQHAAGQLMAEWAREREAVET